MCCCICSSGHHRLFAHEKCCVGTSVFLSAVAVVGILGFIKVIPTPTVLNGVLTGVAGLSLTCLLINYCKSKRTSSSSDPNGLVSVRTRRVDTRKRFKPGEKPTGYRHDKNWEKRIIDKYFNQLDFPGGSNG